MNNFLKKIASGLLFLLFTFHSFAQVDSGSNKDDIMRSNNKIYVVMAVCLTILAGLILYLISIDRKLKKIEKEK